MRVGLFDYALEDWSPPHAATAQRFGECDRNFKVIRVCKGHGTRKAAQTLLHELLHAIYCEFNIEDADDEERTVGAVSGGLSVVWRDNPAVFAWIDHHIQVGS